MPKKPVLRCHFEQFDKSRLHINLYQFNANQIDVIQINDKTNFATYPNTSITHKLITTTLTSSHLI